VDEWLGFLAVAGTPEIERLGRRLVEADEVDA
jgi:hypothetical protein